MPEPSVRTWSFHASDLSADELAWLRPYLAKEWPSYDVQFPEFNRSLNSRYCSMRSEEWFAALAREGVEILWSTPVIQIADQEVHTPREVFSAPIILDARSNAPEYPRAFQKFVGWDIQLEKPHGLHNPLLMDALVPQLEGFRFLYFLPFSDRKLLVEDTRYSDNADLSAIENGLRAEVERRFGREYRILRREQAALALPLELSQSNLSGDLGVAAGFFHPTTGYSLPWAVREAFLTATDIHANRSSAEIKERLSRARESWLYESRFYLTLNRMLFGAADPLKRYKVLQRFYRLPDGLVARFYRGHSTFADKVRILCGRPPVPVTKAIKALTTKGWMEKTI